jgi:hypothetical protein
MTTMSPRARKNVLEARSRERSWWPTLKVTRSRVIVERPRSGRQRFADRVKARFCRLLTYDARRGHWWAEIDRIRVVHGCFAPAVHLSKGAWLALEAASGERPAGHLLLSPEEQAAVAFGETTHDEILQRARAEIYEGGSHA